MTKTDKLILLHFITKTDMFIHPVDEYNIVSFMHGYEVGTKNKCDFIMQLQLLLAVRFRVKAGNKGWPHQITLLSQKQLTGWIITFKQVALQVLADEKHGGLDKKMIEILRTRIALLIERIQPDGHTWFNANWAEGWLSLCSPKRKWFKQLWNKSELLIIIAIDEHVRAGTAFNKTRNNIPSAELLKLKGQWLLTTS